MDELEKLSCPEETLDTSDLDHSASEEKESEEKSKKKKRRRREIDMIRLSDDDDTDDDSSSNNPKKSRLLSPDLNFSLTREPRTCVLKASQKKRPLSRLLEHLLNKLERKDPNNFFAWPVNDNFAPNYSNIIKKPMDFSTMRQKIDDNEYKSLNCFTIDFKLMCNNAMKYNKAGTVYHKAAKRLLHAGLKQLTPQKLRPQGSILTFMYEIPIRELGFDIGKMDVQKVLKRYSPIKSGGSEAEVVSDGGVERQDSGDSLKMQMEAAREKHRKKLAKKAFPRMDTEGFTTLSIVPGVVEGGGEDKPLTLGNYVGKVTQGTGALHIPREDRRNLVKGVKPLHYGPFSSYTPSYDATFATLTKEESHLLYHTLPTETGHGNEELLRFAPDSPWTVIYDMETMFPGKKQDSATQTASDANQDLTKVKVDVDQLRGLSSLGIDMEWLNDAEDDIISSQHDYGIAPALKHTHDILQKLERDQINRLSAPLPWHLSLLNGPNSSERELAKLATACLRGMVSRVLPKHVAPAQSVRRAMGVTLDHLNTPLCVDDVEGGGDTDIDSRSSHDK